MILDVTKFLDNHPGGKFSLSHNIGRDVSKFFYGGYSLENQQGYKVENHVHSNDARKVVNTLIIGKLERDASYRVMSTTPSQQWVDANKSGTTKTIKFVTETGDNQSYQPVGDMMMCSLLDTRNIGKHYLVKSTTHRYTRGGPSPDGEFEDRKGGIKRHYTEAFCMREEVYQSLLKLANSSDSDALE